MQPIRRMYERRSWLDMRLSQLWYSNPSFWFVLILYAIFSHKSTSIYLQLAQELRPDNPLCSSSRTCLHIQIPLHLALLGNFLSGIMLYIIINMIFWPDDGVGGDVLISAAGLKSWYRRGLLVLTILLFVVLGLEDNAVPWISFLYAAFRAALLMAYLVLTMNWWTTTIAKEKDEPPGQELQWYMRNRGSRLVPPNPINLGSRSGRQVTF